LTRYDAVYTSAETRNHLDELSTNFYFLASSLVSRGTRKGVIVSSDLTRRGGHAGMLGGLLWVLFPLRELPEVDLLLAPHVSLAYYGLGYLLPQLLLLMSLQRLHAFHRRSYGWLGSVGLFVSFAALVVAFAGGAFEMIDMASSGTVSTVAHLTLIVGFFILAWGSALLGLAITGTLRDPLLYLGGLLLTIAVPLGLLFVFLTGAAWNFEFWVGLTVPYGVSWMALGCALLRAKGR
jgi:hypothetical protein